MDAIAQYFQRMAEHLPLEIFVLAGTFVEEVISPIPSVLVLFPAGVAAEVQGHSVWFLGILALCSGVGRIAGGSILYWLADRFEDTLLRRHRLFGLSHKEVERFGRHMGRSGRRDWILLFLMNAVPIFPAAVLSLVCGFIKVPYKRYATATFFGTLVNACIYMGIGYAGFMAADVVHGFELAGEVVTGIIVGVIIVWLLRRRITTATLRFLHRNKDI